MGRRSSGGLALELRARTRGLEILLDYAPDLVPDQNLVKLTNLLAMVWADAYTTGSVDSANRLIELLRETAPAS